MVDLSSKQMSKIFFGDDIDGHQVHHYSTNDCCGYIGLTKQSKISELEKVWNNTTFKVSLLICSEVIFNRRL